MSLLQNNFCRTFNVANLDFFGDASHFYSAPCKCKGTMVDFSPVCFHMDESDYHADGVLFRHGGCFMREQADAWRPRGAEEADVSAQGGHHHQDRRAGDFGALLDVAHCCIIFLCHLWVG